MAKNKLEGRFFKEFYIGNSLFMMDGQICYADEDYFSVTDGASTWDISWSTTWRMVRIQPVPIDKKNVRSLSTILDKYDKQFGF